MQDVQKEIDDYRKKGYTREQLRGLSDKYREYLDGDIEKKLKDTMDRNGADNLQYVLNVLFKRLIAVSHLTPNAENNDALLSMSAKTVNILKTADIDSLRSLFEKELGANFIEALIHDFKTKKDLHNIIPDTKQRILLLQFLTSLIRDIAEGKRKVDDTGP